MVKREIIFAYAQLCLAGGGFKDVGKHASSGAPFGKLQKNRRVVAFARGASQRLGNYQSGLSRKFPRDAPRRGGKIDRAASIVTKFQLFPNEAYYAHATYRSFVIALATVSRR